VETYISTLDDVQPTQRDNNRLASIWFGDSAAVKRRAWKEAAAFRVI